MLPGVGHEGFRELGPHDHPDVTLDCIALAPRSSSAPTTQPTRRWTCRGRTSPYPRALGARQIDVVLPDGDDRRLVDAVIFDELVNGDLRDESRREYRRVIERLAARGADVVALVCTEIPLLVTPADSPLPTLDSTRLLARAAFEVAVGHRDMPTWRGGPVAAAG